MAIAAMKIFIGSNKQFYSTRLMKQEYAMHGEGVILVDLQSTSEFFVTVIMKISAALREVVRGDLVVLNAIRAGKSVNDIVESYLPKRMINIAILMLHGLIHKNMWLIRIMASMRTGEALVQMRVGEYEIGACIYDSIIRRMALSSIDRLTLKQRFFVLMELAYFFGLKRYVEKNNIVYVVLPDNAYRNGLLFEIARVKSLPSIVGIDLNGMSMHRYAKAEDYVFHCRTPDEEVVRKVVESESLIECAKQYLWMRTTAQEKQHDVLRAYSSNEHVDRESLVRSYGVNPGKKIALVMAHIFCDAPHAYPGMLFKDYEDWLVKTCVRLSKNDQINYLVKEHPSCTLYGEEGLTKKILESNGLHDKIMCANINTKSLFDSVDVLVTCGGTAGMEFPCFGVPVLVAARSPYCYEEFIRCPSTTEEYMRELDLIHEYEKHDEEDCKRALAVLYVVQSIMKVPREGFGLGTQDYYLGSQIDMANFFKEMEKDCRSGDGYEALVSSVYEFVHGPYDNFIDCRKLHEH